MFWQVLMDELDLSVPPLGKYAVGMVFLPTIEHRREESKKVFNKVAEELGHRILGWRTVKTNNSGLGKGAIDTEPVVAQVFLTPSSRSTSDFEQQVCRYFSSVRAENPGFLMFFLTSNWPN
jgi:glutamate synthase (NADPH/NADH)